LPPIFLPAARGCHARRPRDLVTRCAASGGIVGDDCAGCAGLAKVVAAAVGGE
jgi:hypothetical protein